jgi:hypothetical protein
VLVLVHESAPIAITYCTGLKQDRPAGSFCISALGDHDV